MYQALYRKWRPRTFDDVVGQEHITTTLKNQVSSQKPSHAYLFYGSRGTGKTSCSKILAKAVNCPNQTEGNPCCECHICVGIDNDSILDVTEIDAASNSGVDNIRELREEANFTPVTTKYRVYIIDETHMLSTGAFNALLKIMEEPPPHVIFVLATTEIHKVPATILSRCQRFDFQRLSSQVIAQRLLFVAEMEQMNLTEQAALLIGRLSDGALRDALSLLDLCIAMGGEITYEKIEEVAGLSDRGYLGDMAKKVAQDDYFGALGLFGELWIKSINPTQFCQQLIGFYRDILIAKASDTNNELLEATAQEFQELRALAAEYSVERIFYSINTLSETLGRMSTTSMRRAEMETGLLKLCNMSVSITPEAINARLERLEQRMVSGDVVTQPNILVKSSVPQNKSNDVTDDGDLSASPKTKPTKPNNSTEVQPFSRWAEVLELLKSKNMALFSTLIDSKAYVTEDLLLVDAGSELFAHMVRTDEYAKNSLRDTALAVTGLTYRLGPYKPERYEVKVKSENQKLDDILKSAQELGVDIEINE